MTGAEALLRTLVGAGVDTCFANPGTSEMHFVAVLNNRSYAVLNLELQRVGAGAPGSRALEMLNLQRPNIDFVHLAQGFWRAGLAATTADELVLQLERSVQSPGPSLIEAVLPSPP